MMISKSPFFCEILSYISSTIFEKGIIGVLICARSIKKNEVIFILQFQEALISMLKCELYHDLISVNARLSANGCTSNDG